MNKEDAVIELKWKRRKNGSYLAVYMLAYALPDLDIRRKGPLHVREVKRFPFEGVEKTSVNVQPNRRVPFKQADQLGLNVKSAHLELRWERQLDDLEWPWICHYELHVPLADGRVLKAKMGGTRRGGDAREPINHDGTVETPFRDGAHARWDSERLGLLAVAICGSVTTEINQETRPVMQGASAK